LATGLAEMTEVSEVTEQVDVVVVGQGPGGEDAAKRLAQAGLAVVAIDGRLLGGECPYYGCVPSKIMIRRANALAEAGRVDDLAGSAVVRPDWGPVARRIREATADWDDSAAVQRLEEAGGRFVRGRARLDGPNRVVVDDHVFEARRALVLNPGTVASIAPVDGLADTPFWTNREAVETERVPSSMAVLGGGAIGAELGQAFRRFGAEVTVVETADRLVAPEEPEAGRLLVRVFEREGITVRSGAHVTGVAYDGDRFSLEVDGGDAVVCEVLLVATGRHTELAELNVASIGVDEHARFLPVDDHLRVVDGVWAIGDACGHGAFTHVSMYHADIVVNDILGRPVHRADYRGLSRVTFTDPEIGSVGLTEAQARADGIDVRSAVTDLPSSPRGWIHGPGNDGFIKLVADASRRVLVGATSVGPSGGEVLSMLTLAVHAEVPIEQLRTMIYAYPTFHRAVLDALSKLETGAA
jgi:pyruvate/2-oxoglutarate dehydrogenase complex dihydrolipoamide dehydrogenase (E3) component